MQQTELL